MNKINTPWGLAQYVRFHGIDRCVFQVRTTEHGGIGVNAFLANQEMPAHLGALGTDDDSGVRWFEEDLAFAAVLVAWPQRFPHDWYEPAKRILRDEFPDAYMAQFDEKLTAQTSRKLEELQWQAATRDNFVVTTGFGDWAYDVPEGKVWACGWRARDEATAGFLVPDSEYMTNPMRLVLDNYPRWEPDRSLPHRKPERLLAEVTT